MVFAKRYIQYIPKVRLEGYIKNSKKRFWETVFEDAKKGKHRTFKRKLSELLEFSEDHVFLKGACICPGYECYHFGSEGRNPWDIMAEYEFSADDEYGETENELILWQDEDNDTDDERDQYLTTPLLEAVNEALDEVPDMDVANTG
ncbi:hypothetical protein BU16DRAFT_196165 [Lophium mytilinum]|uniref:Uncharacterized protein n=1 Tax=Lophium mytilinum TaxID=390894 RepID=A0A6A6RC60_9PEZI|nr:hypothetical protein BU16DRAFT_196165 [Lophium mytilinum]